MKRSDIKYVEIYNSNHDLLAKYDLDSSDNSDGILLALVNKLDQGIITCVNATTNDAMNTAKNLILLSAECANKSPMEISLLIIESIIKTQNGGNDSEKDRQENK